MVAALEQICRWRRSHIVEGLNFVGNLPPDAKRLGGRPAKKAKARDVFVYFDNDVKVRAPFDAMSLARRLDACPPTSKPAAAPEGGQVNELPRERWPGYQRRRRNPRKARS